MLIVWDSNINLASTICGSEQTTKQRSMSLLEFHYQHYATKQIYQPKINTVFNCINFIFRLSLLQSDDLTKTGQNSIHMPVHIF